MPFGYLSLNLLSFYSEEWTRPQPRSGPFLWPWNPPDWRKWSQVKVTCLLQSTYSVQFSAKCLLPKANSQKFLYNSSPSVCDCSLILCASKTEFWPKKKKKVFVPCFKVMELSPLISWQFPEESFASSTLWPCSSTVETAAKFTVSICILR